MKESNELKQFMDSHSIDKNKNWRLLTNLLLLKLSSNGYYFWFLSTINKLSTSVITLLTAFECKSSSFIPTGGLLGDDGASIFDDDTSDVSMGVEFGIESISITMEMSYNTLQHAMLGTWRGKFNC